LKARSPHVPLGADTGADTACRVYLVRHGRTIMNVEIRFRGRLEIPLDEKGREEAWQAATSLAGAGLTAVYTSPLGRAREVADAISTTTGAPVVSLPDLVNLDYGDWEGLTKEECAARDPDAWHCYRTDPETAACPGGEALSTAADRVMRALRTIGETHPGEAVAAVTHGVMVRLAMLRAAPRPDTDWEVPLATGSSTLFEVCGEDVHLVAGPAAKPPVRVSGPVEGVPGEPVGSPAYGRAVVAPTPVPALLLPEAARS
jgi:broad specificity phosphatase PhoE